MNKKLTALLLCAVMLVSVLVSCTKPVVEQNGDVVENAGENAEQNAESTPAGEPFDFADVDLSKVTFYTPDGAQTGYIDNNGEQIVPEYVVKINGIPVSLEEFRYPYLSVKFMKDNGDTALWTEEAAEESRLTAEDLEALEKEVIDYLKQTTLYQLMSVKYNLPLTEEDIKTVNDNIQATIDSMNVEGSEYTYEQALEDSFLTDPLYRYTNTIYSIANKIYNHLYFDENAPLGYTAEEAVKVLEDAGYVRAQHILVQFPEAPAEGTDEEKAAAAEQGKADALKEAEEVLEKVNAGEDFMALVEQYNDDPGMDMYGEDGYYFNKGYMVKEFEDATYALEFGATSGIVETTYGYHIIKRLPLEVEYVSENAQTLLGEIYSADFNERILATYETMNVEYAPEYELISPTTLH